MKYLKKIVAISTIASLLIASSMTTNAAINGTTASTTGFADGSTITITDSGAAFIDANEIVTAVITNLDGSATTTTLTAVGANVNNNTSELTTTNALANNTSYFIQFTTADGSFGTTTLRVGTPTNDTLTVTATVEPVLKFDMEANSGSFGVLSTTATGVTTGIEVGTNAIGGLTVTAESTNGGLNSTTATHLINSDATDGDGTLYDAESYTFQSTLGVSDSDGTATIAGLASTEITNAVPGTSNVRTVYSSDKPQNFDGVYDVNFTVEASIAESTPSASDYTDVIIFTATANF